MRKWMQAVLGVILVALSLQCVVYFRGTPLLGAVAVRRPPPVVASAAPLTRAAFPVTRDDSTVTRDHVPVTRFHAAVDIDHEPVNRHLVPKNDDRMPVNRNRVPVNKDNAPENGEHLTVNRNLVSEHSNRSTDTGVTLGTRRPSLRTSNSSSNGTKTVQADPHRHHPFPFTLNQPAACRPDTELVFVVITAVSNFDDRQSVRDTWGSYANDVHHNTSLVFLLGSTHSPLLQARLTNESQVHGDIVQEGFVDSYRNLSLKSVALLKWVSLYCNRSRFVMKADDDMYINVPNLLSALRKEAEARPMFVMGHVFVGAVPQQNRNSKWYTPLEQFNEKVYPRYTSGTAYAMTTAAALKLYRAAAAVPVFWLEDIYVTGLCARKADVPILHHGGFNYQRQTNICVLRKAITSHKITANEKRTFYKQVHDPQIKCK
ncbi:beta-1,3-galactosyltransferase 1-like [Littorina saxatilis]|uniref:Hexosyltransferase n=1 Tax=Littorina saxatilis TaxID=31220 RepID=A0AAN9ATD7_9CAEN